MLHLLKTTVKRQSRFADNELRFGDHVREVLSHYSAKADPTTIQILLGDDVDDDEVVNGRTRLFQKAVAEFVSRRTPKTAGGGPGETVDDTRQNDATVIELSELANGTNVNGHRSVANGSGLRPPSAVSPNGSEYLELSNLGSRGRTSVNSVNSVDSLLDSEGSRGNTDSIGSEGPANPARPALARRGKSRKRFKELSAPMWHERKSLAFRPGAGAGAEAAGGGQPAVSVQASIAYAAREVSEITTKARRVIGRTVSTKNLIDEDADEELTEAALKNKTLRTIRSTAAHVPSLTWPRAHASPQTQALRHPRATHYSPLADPPTRRPADPPTRRL